MEGFSQQGNCLQSAIGVPNVEGQDQRVESVGRGVFLPFNNSPFCDLSMILVGINWTSGGGSGKTKLVRKKQGHSIEEDEDDEDVQMLNNVPLKKRNSFNKKDTQEDNESRK